MYDSVFAQFLHSRSDKTQTMAELVAGEQPLRLMPAVTADDLPPEFEDVLQVQVLGYRERFMPLEGHRLHVLDPVWTLVPKHE